LTFELAEKSATGKVERRWLSYALDLMRLTQPPLQRARSCILASSAVQG